MAQHKDIHKTISSIKDILAETIWPTRCAVCDIPGEVLCERCASKLVLVDACKACPKCGAPYGIVQCSECNDVIIGLIGRQTFPLDGFASPFILDEGARRIVTAYKDKDEHRLCSIIAEYMTRYINPDWIVHPASKDADAQTFITFIPSTKAAFRRRGFDHAENIAREIADKANVDCLSIFERPKSRDQRQLGRAARSKNTEGQFQIRSEFRSHVETFMPKRIILVDDICTTGATMYAAADTLKAFGAEKVYGLTFGKVIA